MGAWGTGPFGNDDGADWVIAVVDSGDVDEVATALEIVAETDANVRLCCHAVAAAEVVSAARGYACRGFPQELKVWIREHGFYADRVLTTAAKTAVRKVLAGSELAEEWGGHPGWKRRMNNLAKRLSQPSKAKRPKAKKKPIAAATGPTDTKTMIKNLKKMGAYVFKTPDGEIECIDMSEGRVTSSDLPAFVEMIAGISSLVAFAIYFDGFADSDLEHVSKLPHLEELIISSCKVTDKGMKHVAKMSTLSKLDIKSCEGVTDAGLRHLTKLSALKLLKARRTGVTKRGVAAFRKAVPGCTVDTTSPF